MEPLIVEEARKHGLSDEAIRHAFDNPIRVHELDEEMTLLVGADPAGNLLEVGVVDSYDGPVIIHAMPARLKYLT